MRVIGVDPGNEQTALAVIECGKTPRLSGFLEPNHAIRERLGSLRLDDRVGIEMIASYGMAVGETVFETCVWIGRFAESVERSPAGPAEPVFIKRLATKLHLCKSPRAKDANVRQALIDRWGAPGTKKAPGPTHGFRKDMWAALAVATTLYDQLEGGEA